ncbi:MAG: amidase [Myxococcota bacterium]
MDELAQSDCMALADLVRRREVSPLELVDAAIARIGEVNPKLNAVVTPMFESAREQAKGGAPQGPFGGVPYLLKDILASCEGVRLTSGSRALQEYVPDHDSILVQRLREAGFLFVGKTNVPEFGFLPTTEPALFGPCRNPWDPTRTTGGSSGGSAAAVAAGVVPAAHANDGGGSIRIPAACCGLFGLKPTRGRISLGPDLGDIMNGFVVEHCVSRTVRDSAAILDATQGPAPGDPYFAPPPPRPYLEDVGAPAGELHIAFTTTAPNGGEVHPDCVAAVRAAAQVCEELGHHVEEVQMPAMPSLVTDMFMVVWSAGAAATLDGFGFALGRPLKAEEVEPPSWALAEQGRQHSAGMYLMATALLQRMAREAAPLMAQHHVILAPTLAEPPLPLGSFDAPPDNPMAAMERASSFTPFAALANVTGQPSMSVPLHWNDAGLPIGVQFTGRYGDEATLFRLAAQLEEARPWAGRVPPVWAGSPR